MEETKLSIVIGKPVQEVFEFTTQSVNTPKWIDSIVKEEMDTEKVGVGTKIINWDEFGQTNQYLVTIYEPNQVFQIESTVADYKLRYSYKALSKESTELEYHEWSESGGLHTDSMQAILNKLKDVLEKR